MQTQWLTVQNLLTKGWNTLKGLWDEGFNVEAANMGHWSKEKKICAQLLTVNGYFLHFGWHSNGLGKCRHAKIEEVLLVAHGRAHNDTICTAERKTA